MYRLRFVPPDTILLSLASRVPMYHGGAGGCQSVAAHFGRSQRVGTAGRPYAISPACNRSPVSTARSAAVAACSS